MPSPPSRAFNSRIRNSASELALVTPDEADVVARAALEYGQ
jgi:hypothetical protein